MAVLRFDRYTLNTATLELWRNGSPVEVRPQPARVLALLAARPGEIVSREELKAAVWPEGIYVHFDLGLNSCIKQVRAALADGTGTGPRLETLRGRGYRLVLAEARREGGTRRLALLPVRPLERDPRLETFASGLTDELLTQVTRNAPGFVVVVGPNSLPAAVVVKPSLRLMRGYGIDLVLESRIRRGTSGWRLSVQMFDAVEQTNLLAESYDGDMADILASQDALARAVIADLVARLRAEREDQAQEASLQDGMRI